MDDETEVTALLAGAQGEEEKDLPR